MSSNSPEMTLNEALDRVYARHGTSAEYLLLRQAVRALTPEQVAEIEALSIEPLILKD